jgi:acylphosphatase
MVCIRYRVTGRVQGVFFRASTRREAQNLGLTGYAKNLPDGSVEVLACGPESAVEQLGEWLWVGPPAARVSQVDGMPVNAESPPDFSIS